MILKHIPQKKKLSESTQRIRPNLALAASVAEASREMRRSSMRTFGFDADA